MIWNVLYLICYVAGKCYETIVGLSVIPCRDIAYTKQALSLHDRCLDSAGNLCESLRGIAEGLQTNLGGDEVCLQRWPFPNLKSARICGLRTSLSAQSQPWSYTSFLQVKEWWAESISMNQKKLHFIILLWSINKVAISNLVVKARFHIRTVIENANEYYNYYLIIYNSRFFYMQ